MYFLKNRIIDNNKIFFPLIFLFFIIFNIIFYLLFVQKYPTFIDSNGNLMLNALTHSYSDILINLVSKGKYYSNFFNFNVDFYAGRLPFIPFFLFFIYQYVSTKFIIILIIKNTILFSLVIFFSKLTLKKNLYVLILVSSLFLIPYNFQIFLLIVPEEAYLNYLIACLFLVFISSIKHKEIYITILLVCLFFIKGSFCFFIYSIILYFWIFEKKKLPLLTIMICYFCWASYVYNKTDKIISPISLESIGGVTLSSSNNDQFLDLYPLSSLDSLYSNVLAEHQHETKKLNNEFEIDNYFKKVTIDYIKDNKIQFLKGLSKKIQVIFFNIREDGKDKDHPDYGKVQISNIFNILILIVTMFFLIIKILNKKFKNKEIFYTIFFLSYLFPFLIGFVYTRHLTPIYIISIIYLLDEILKNYFNTKRY